MIKTLTANQILSYFIAHATVLFIEHC